MRRTVYTRIIRNGRLAPLWVAVLMLAIVFLPGVRPPASTLPQAASASERYGLADGSGDSPGDARTAAQIEPRIVGGTPVPVGTYRFMTYLKIGPYLCGGSLIDATHVLTAAHCLYGESAGSITAYIGGNVNSVNGPTGSILRYASGIAIDPQYNPNNEENDAAVITLSEAVPSAANGGVDPISFVWSGSTLGLTPDQLLTVAGWGTTSYQGSLSNQLLAVDVPVQTDAYCKQQYGLTNQQIAVMFCAGPKTGGQDSCQGDSGGPIFFLNDGVYTQVGIVSWGNGCAWAGYPGVYSRIAAASINSFIAGYVAPLPTPTPTATSTATSTATTTPSATPTATPIVAPTATPSPADVTRPSVVITAPQAGAKVQSPVKITVKATDNESGVAKVTLYRCDTLPCTLIKSDTAAPYTFKVSLQPGTHKIKAVAIDRAGNSGESGIVKFTVPKASGKGTTQRSKPAANAERSGQHEPRVRPDARRGKNSSRLPDTIIRP